MRFLVFIVLSVYAWSLSKPVTTIVNFTMNQEQIAEELCENKDKPVMECNGKCYLMKQLSQDLDLEITEASKDSKDKEGKETLETKKPFEKLEKGIHIAETFKIQSLRVKKPYLRSTANVSAELLIPPPQFI